MSYILDALKKSDQQRQRGATPTLRSAPVIEAPPPKKTSWVLLAFAIAALIAALFIGWLRPWHSNVGEAGHTAERDSSGSIAAAPTAAPAAAPTATPSIDMPATTPAPAINAPVAPLSLPPSAASPSLTLPSGPTSAASATTPAPAGATPPVVEAAPAQPQLPTLTELSPVLRQDMPALAISLHAYAVKPEKRLVSINNQLLHEGDAIAPDFTIEAITPDGMVLNFRGTRFRHGVQ